MNKKFSALAILGSIFLSACGGSHAIVASFEDVTADSKKIGYSHSFQQVKSISLTGLFPVTRPGDYCYDPSDLTPAATICFAPNREDSYYLTREVDGASSEDSKNFDSSIENPPIPGKVKRLEVTRVRNLIQDMVVAAETLLEAKLRKAKDEFAKLTAETKAAAQKEEKKADAPASDSSSQTPSSPPVQSTDPTVLDNKKLTDASQTNAKLAIGAAGEAKKSQDAAEKSKVDAAAAVITATKNADIASCAAGEMSKLKQAILDNKVKDVQLSGCLPKDTCSFPEDEIRQLQCQFNKAVEKVTASVQKEGVIVFEWESQDNMKLAPTFTNFLWGNYNRTKTMSGFGIIGGLRSSTLFVGPDIQDAYGGYGRWPNVVPNGPESASRVVPTGIMQAKYIAYYSNMERLTQLAENLETTFGDLERMSKDPQFWATQKLQVHLAITNMYKVSNLGLIGPGKILKTPMFSKTGSCPDSSSSEECKDEWKTIYQVTTPLNALQGLVK